ncbi:MAG: hypothetical protein CMJ29_03550 [Phycisphaerae bacterium]|nr:hypothetical protein [Phycisphaerae bacterium]MAT80706.1 hypothetical protein [Phycisphaerae bacterium]|tara:strand:+ start:789 stop:1295 length:507 start_codon:yes stop_codon:yes gene_type:complete
MTTTCNLTGTALAGSIRFLMNMAKPLVSDIDAQRFSDSCDTTINHPAFVLGHCAYYVGYCMQMLGSDIELPDSHTDLYQHGAECMHMHDGYDDKESAIAHFMERLETAASFVEGLDDSVFARSTEGTFFEDRMPNMATVANFMMVAHVTFHLGQVSGWRRVAGYGAAG